MKDESGTIQVVGSFLVGVACLITACSRPSSTADSSALKPIDQAALQTMVDTTAKELLVPGAVVLLRTPQGEFTVTYGTTQLGTTSPPRADTRFRIASNTKSMTAAVIVQLAQEGKLSLDDPVSKYVPSVPNGDNITIDELLTMRSGLYNYTDASELAAAVDRDPTKVWTTEELLAIALARSPNFPPGTAYEYNNTNYTLLGLIAEKVDGKPLARAMQDRRVGCATGRLEWRNEDATAVAGSARRRVCASTASRTRPTISLPRNGFSMKSRAPFLIASTAIGMSP